MKKAKAAAPKSWWRFTGEDERFEATSPDSLSRLYFPLCNEAGLLSAITPTLHGDIKAGQNQFLTEPVSEQDLHNKRSSRQFWVYVEGKGPWSATASKPKETAHLEAGALWHKVTRENKAWGLRATLTNFIPAGPEQVEIMRVELTNTGRKPLALTATAAIPLYGRSADNVRDHRHVTSLLHRIEQVPHGVLVTPTMSFDERGHHPNQTVYGVLGAEAGGEAPLGSFPTVNSFVGEGSHFDAPRAVFEDWDAPDLDDAQLHGREAMGALRFKSRKLAPGKSVTYLVLLGIAQEKKDALGWLRAYGTAEKVQEALEHTKAFWKERLDRLQVRTDDADFGPWVRWVSLQPVLRKIFGCSFLPDFDYGRGGRGWRDLWQDCLALLLLDSGDVRALLLNNFAGVRANGTNATIIGKKPGEFVADRNNISRTWMDHGVWPWITTELYLHQTGDLKFLLEEVPYFEGGQGTVLEHIIVQHLTTASNLGEHGNCKLLDADWNDGLDMAPDRGESVAFTAVYAGNLLRIADTLLRLKSKLGLQDIVFKGSRKSIEDFAADLSAKGEMLASHVREREWIKSGSGHAWFNGYYNNKGERVEGDHPKGVRMTLTGQVFPIMSGVASNEQVTQAFAAAKRYLQDKKLGGYRLNTDFKEIQLDLGRAFSFAYGEKENGAFFSHMTVMFANALYSRGFVEEGHDVFSSLYKMATNAAVSKIYPGMPEYCNGEGRGMYMYLTGSASWYLLTLVTQVLGIRGQWGDLLLVPKLVPEQFGKSGQISAEVGFAGKRLKVTYLNRSRKPFGQYRIESVLMQGKTLAMSQEVSAELVIPRSSITNQASPSIDITVSLS
jgi:cellobiose phosphorylase